MAKIQIVNETGCFMYLDNEGNYLKSFFIGKYWFDLMTSQQKQTLKELLEKETITPMEIFYKHEKVYLTFINAKDIQCVYEIYTTGEVKAYWLDEFVKELKVIDYSSFHTLHDFSEKTHVKATFENGEYINTSINGTLQDAKDYYLGNPFNIGNVTDDMQIAVNVEVI